MNCKQLDHDGFNIVCGYPLPCPWHTVVIDTTKSPATVTIPVTSNAMAPKARKRIGQIARVLVESDGNSAVIKSKRKRQRRGKNL